MEKASKRNILTKMTVMSANSPALIHSLSVDFFFFAFLSPLGLSLFSPVVIGDNFYSFYCLYEAGILSFPGLAVLLLFLSSYPVPDGNANDRYCNYPEEYLKV